MKADFKKLIVCILIPLVVGVAAAFLTREGMENFTMLNKPPLSPPAQLFPVAWTILYTLMGISSYIIYREREEKNNRDRLEGNTVGKKEKRQALEIYGYQLLVNFLWPVFFFQFQWYFFAFLWLVLLWILVARMILAFGNISEPAAFLNVPYLLWLSFAGYLNLGIWLLN